MLQLSNGKILLNGKECNNPEEIFYSLLDFSEQGNFDLVKQ